MLVVTGILSLGQIAHFEVNKKIKKKKIMIVFTGILSLL